VIARSDPVVPAIRWVSPGAYRNRARSGAEQRARTTAVTILAAAHIGPSRRDPPVGPPVVLSMVRAHRARPVDLVGIGLLDR
jgi:hypothetical protein